MVWLMDKYNFFTILFLFTLLSISGLRADDDISEEISDRQAERSDRRSDIQAEKSDRRSDRQDQRSEFRTNVSENTGDGQVQLKVSDKRSDVYDNYQENNNGNVTRGAVAYNRNNNPIDNVNNYGRNRIGYDNPPYNSGIRVYYNNAPPPARTAVSPLSPRPAAVANDVDPTLQDFRTGLSYGTLKILSSLPTCDQQTLLNYRRLLRTPSIRLQFYRDLYQMKQKNYLEGCGEGLVKIGYRQRAILLRDPYFRRKVEGLMARQPIGAAIRGPVHYPNDIDATPQPVDPILILNKRY